MRNLAAVLALPLLLAGCATIVSHSSWPVSLTSTPDGATVEVVDEKGAVIHRATTPCLVTLSSYGGYFSGADYTVQCRKAGSADAAAPLHTRFNGWYLGNLVFGGLLGILVVDPLTGAMWRLPETVHVDLVPAPSAAPMQ